jgi:photosynthetic reaction center cytochrome c subunit
MFGDFARPNSKEIAGMRKAVHLAVCLSVSTFAIVLRTGSARPSPSPAQDKPAAQAAKTAEQQFKNIQVLKGIPADQLIPTMQFIAASLNVECEFCHVEHQMDKDDKKEKKIARKMISMELAIDKDNFDGNLNVTCYTCHRGNAHPVSIPVLLSDAERPAPHVHNESESHPNLPAANDVLDKYLAAVGGSDALKKIKTRVEKGTINAGGHQSAIEIYCQAPDKRVSISHMQGGNSVTAFNGQAGWLSITNGVHRMSPVEMEGARIDATMYLPAELREMYKQFRVVPGEAVNGHDTIVVSATEGETHPALRLYFDPQTGLLVRMIRYTESALGRLPTQVDYADYRSANGVKIPYQWTITRPNGSFTIHVTEVRQNVPVDEKLFAPPPAEAQGK